MGNRKSYFDLADSMRGFIDEPGLAEPRKAIRKLPAPSSAMADSTETTRIPARLAGNRNPYLMKVDVVDHITPLRGQRLEKVKNKNELTETIDLEALLRDFGLQRDTAPIGSKATSSTLSESSFDDDRGVYLHDDEALKPEVEGAMFIKGNCFVGQRVQLVDNHRLAAKYPLKNIMWHRGTEEGHEIVFSPVPFAEGIRIVTIPESALGSYIKAEGYRVLPTEERDVHDDMFFDPHLHEQDDLTEATVKRSFSVTSGPVMIAPEWALRTLPLLVDPPFVVEFLNFDQSGNLYLSYEGFWVEDRAHEQKKSAVNWMKSLSAEDEEKPEVMSWADFRCEVRFSHRAVATLHFVGDETSFMFIVKTAVFWQAAIFCWLMCDSQGRNDRAKWRRWHERSDVDAIMKATVKYLPTMK